VNGKGLALVIRMIGLSDESIIFIIDGGKNFSLIISLKASAWKLSEKMRDVFKSFFITKIDIP
jgi:hypothetical protein